MKASLDDLYKEQWIRKRDSKEIVWTTRDGREVPVKEMSDTHLNNTIKYLEKIKEYKLMKTEFDALKAEYEAYWFEHL